MPPAQGIAPDPCTSDLSTATDRAMSQLRDRSHRIRAVTMETLAWPLHPALRDITGPLTRKWSMAVSLSLQGAGRGLCPGTHAEKPHGSGRGRLPDATGSEQKEGQGATGTPRALWAALSLQALCGPASGGRDRGLQCSFHRPWGRAVLSAHVLRPPQEPCGVVRQSWAQPRTPQVNQGGERAARDPAQPSFPRRTPWAVARHRGLPRTPRSARCPSPSTRLSPVPGPSAQASGCPHTLLPRRQRLRFLAKPPPGT